MHYLQPSQIEVAIETIPRQTNIQSCLDLKGDTRQLSIVLD
jgi:hypothetical protein